MAAQVGAISVDLEAKIANFTANMDRARANLQQNTAEMSRGMLVLEKSMGAVRSMVTGFVAGLGTAALLSAAKAALDTAGGLGELAEQLGVSTDALQVYQFAAVQNGISSEQMEKAVSKLSQTIGDAARGNAQALKTFSDLGIGVLDAGGKVRSTEAVLADVADRLAAVDDPAARASLAVDLFGRSGQRLLPILSQGRAGLESYEAAARSAGAVLSDDLIKGADTAADTIARMEHEVGKLAQTIVASAAPAISSFFRFFNEQFGTDRTVALRIADAIADLDKIKARRDAILKGTTDLVDPVEIEREVARLAPLISAAEKRVRDLQAQIPASAVSVTAPAPAAGNTNPTSEAEQAKIDAATDSLRKKIDALEAEAVALEKGERAGKLYLVEQELIAKVGPLVAGGANESAYALMGEYAAALKAAEARKRLNEEIQRSVGLALQFIDAREQEEAARGALEAQRNKLVQDSERETQEIREQIEAAKLSTIVWNDVTKSYEVNDRQLQIMIKTQQLLRQSTTLTLEEAKRLATEQVDAERELKKNTDDLQKQADKLNDLGRDLGLTFTSAFEDAVVGGKKFSDVLKGIEQDIIRIVLRKSVTEPAGDFISNLVKGFGAPKDGKSGGGLFGGLGDILNTGGVAGQGFLSFLGFADGGRPPVGVPSMVGERGPELFIPDGSGTIIPREDLAAAPGGGISVVNNYDFRGSDGASVTRLRAESERIQRATIDQLVARVNQGGALSRAMGRRRK